MKLIIKLSCFLFRHKYGVIKEFTPTTRMVGCMRCKKLWAMNDEVKSFLPWDREFEELYFGDKPWSLGFKLKEK